MQKTTHIFLSLLVISGLAFPFVEAGMRVARADTVFSDTEGHWAADAIQEMYDLGAVSGHPDGGFAPDGSLNRAEAASLIDNIVLPPSVDLDADPFPDVSMDEWYAQPIAQLANLALVEGNPDGYYEPARNINRAEFLTLSLNTYSYLLSTSLPAESDEVNYSDVEAGVWYEDAVVGATVAGFVEGSECGDERCFNPGDDITRAEATVILHRMFADYLDGQMPITLDDDETASTYVDGSYGVQVTYDSPGGDDDMGVELTLEDDVVTAVSITNLASNGISEEYQDDFSEGIESLVVGVALDELEEFDSVSGASLTSEAFNEAVEQIREDALR